VGVIWVVGDLSVMNTQLEPRWLIPSHNHVIGWLAFAWIAIIAMAYWRLSVPARDSEVGVGISGCA